jgi:hypothetical protein
LADQIKLSDEYLLSVANQHLEKVFPAECFPGKTQLEMRQGLNSRFLEISANISKVQASYDAPFSLFQYESFVRLHPEEGESLSRLWNRLLWCSAAVLRWNDRRENPSHQTGFLPRIDGTEELSEYYEKVIQFERILYGLDTWYRDHFSHVLRVWLLGIYVILERGNNITAPAIHAFIDNHAFKESELLSAFTIAALTHDLGYPLEKSSQVNDKIAEMFGAFGGMEWSRLTYNFSPQRHELGQLLLSYLSGTVGFVKVSGGATVLPDNEKLGDDLKRVLKNYADKKPNSTRQLAAIQNEFDAEYRIILRTQHTYLRKYADSLESFHHGIISALILLRKFRYFKEGEFSSDSRHYFLLEEARQYLIRRDILRAAASHTCREIYYLDPLTIESLLFFCDEIQEWGRPRFSELHSMKAESLSVPSVFLEKYTRDGVEWSLNAGKISSDGALRWAFSMARKLREVLSGPTDIQLSDRGKFQVKWTLNWEQAGNSGTKGIVTFNKSRDHSDSGYKFELKLNGHLELLNRQLEEMRTGETSIDKEVGSLVQKCSSKKMI